MPSVSTNEFKSGLKIMMDGAPCNIVENVFVKPGKGQAFSRVKYRNLLTGRVLEKTFKSGESVELADASEKDVSFLYADGEYWHFMCPSTYEQMMASATVMAEAKQWLKEEDECMATLWNGDIIAITPPKFADLIVTTTDPGLKGDTSGGGSKPATLETGAVVRVPLFIQEGEKIRVDTRTGEYDSRVKG